MASKVNQPPPRRTWAWCTLSTPHRLSLRGRGCTDATASRGACFLPKTRRCCLVRQELFRPLLGCRRLVAESKDPVVVKNGGTVVSIRYLPWHPEPPVLFLRENGFALQWAFWARGGRLSCGPPHNCRGLGDEDKAHSWSFSSTAI